MRDKVKESELWSEAFIMVKIGMFLPEERMVEPARKIIEENHLDVVYLEAVHTVDAVNKARIAVEAGAHILVARGYQAKLIKEYTAEMLLAAKNLQFERAAELRDIINQLKVKS